jgi:hypothetical protein
MGANAQTKVPTFASAEVLTAANQNLLSNGIPVFSGTATRNDAFGGSGEKVLAEGQFAYLEDSNTTQYYDGAAWQSVATAPGLVLIKTQTIGTTVSSVEVTDAFSATYDAYKIIVSGGVCSTSADMRIQLGSATTLYNHQLIYGNYGASLTGAGGSSQSNFARAGAGNTSYIQINAEISNPFLAKNTFLNASLIATDLGGPIVGIHTGTTSFTAFTILPSTGTMTGGTIRVYGYANS